MSTGRHHVCIWKDSETIIRPWRWRCQCQRWRPFSWEYHWDFDTARRRALAHLTEVAA